MASRSDVPGRMDGRVSELASGFGHGVGAFSDSEWFGGPSLYFHQRPSKGGVSIHHGVPPGR